MEPLARFLAGRVGVYVGDLTDHRVDAIVNAANSTLLGGGGIDGAIHRRGGPAILEACREIRRNQWPQGLPTGEAVATTGGELPAPWVIHTVGPIYGQHGGDEPRLLARCYRQCLSLAGDMGLGTVAFPAISTGVYGYPQALAAPVVSAALKDFLAMDTALAEVRLVFFQPAHSEVFLAHHTLGAPS